MKTLIAAASVAAIAALAPAFAQAQTVDSAALNNVYGTLGYAGASSNGADVGTIQGRLGYRFLPNFGVEGELATGVKSDHTDVAGTSVRTKIGHEEAIYGVGFLPLNEKIDLLARVGYGNTRVKYSALGESDHDNLHSWNYGAGAQYHFDGVNGVRADYTRQEFTGSGDGHADVWSVAYTRRF
jgi:outer membrane immunogenic protein